MQHARNYTLSAGDCKLEYDRATGCYLDHSQLVPAADMDLYGSFAQSAPESVGHFLPPPGPSYDEVFQGNGSNRDSEKVPEMAEALQSSLSPVDKVFQSRAANSKRQELPRNHVAQHVGVSEGPLSNEELEYDETDIRSGDQVQQFQHGQSAQVMSVR